MQSRLLVIGTLVMLGVLWMLGVAFSAAEAPEYEVYVAQEGQTLQAIAAEYQMPAEYLALFNRLDAKSALNPGQVLLVPIVVMPKPAIADRANPDYGVQNPPPPPEQYRKPREGEIEGWQATVVVEASKITTKPAGGTVLWDKLRRGDRLLVIGQSGDHYAVMMVNGVTAFVAKQDLVVSATPTVVKKPAQSQTATATLPTGGGRQDAVNTAFEYLGKPYKYGGQLPDNVDCSLLIQTVYGRLGVRLPRTAAEQFQVGAKIEYANLLPGDRLYFYDKDMARIGHTGMYIGEGKFIHASSNRKMVAVDELATPNYWKKYAGARR